MTRNVSQAEDLAQDVFIQLFRKIDTFRGESSFSTWLHRLTVNQVLMHCQALRTDGANNGRRHDSGSNRERNGEPGQDVGD